MSDPKEPTSKRFDRDISCHLLISDLAAAKVGKKQKTRKIGTQREAMNETENSEHEVPKPASWQRASLDDVAGVDFERPIVGMTTADCAGLSDKYRTAVQAHNSSEGLPDTSEVRVFNMLWSLTGMHFKPNEPNEPFWADDDISKWWPLGNSVRLSWRAFGSSRPHG